VSQPSILENLYTEELYQVPPRLLVVISKPWSQVSEEERTVLTKMLVAVKLSLAAVHILHRTELSLNDLAAFNLEKVLCFGASLKGASKLYEHVVIDRTSVIVADALESLDDVKKKNLWLALKQMFGL
jgi:hypothetical protein